MVAFFQQYFATIFERRTALITGLVILGFVVLGLFGTFGKLSVIERVWFWTPLCLIAVATSALVHQITTQFFAAVGPRVKLALFGLGFVLLYSPIIFLISDNQILTDEMPTMPFWQIILTIAGFAFTFGSLLPLLTPPAVTQSAENLPRIYARLQDIGGARVARLSVSDHYTNVYLSDGRTQRLLMRFVDAVREMDDTPGFCTHRSHWVAAAEIVEGHKVGQKEWLSLSCGALIPVSKTYRQSAVDAGYLGQEQGSRAVR